MSTPRHDRFLKKAALRAAQRAIDRNAGGSFDKERLLKLRVQTVEPWKRVLFVVLGLVIAGVGVRLCFSPEPILPVVVATVLALPLLWLGFFGRKRTIDGVLDAMTSVEVAGELLSALIELLN